VASGFAGQKGIHFEIHAPKGSHGAFVDSLSVFPQEKEVIFPPKTKYKVLSATIDSQGRKRVVLGVQAPNS
jgi:hypothetical protein